MSLRKIHEFTLVTDRWVDGWMNRVEQGALAYTEYPYMQGELELKITILQPSQ